MVGVVDGVEVDVVVTGALAEVLLVAAVVEGELEGELEDDVVVDSTVDVVGGAGGISTWADGGLVTAASAVNPASSTPNTPTRNAAWGADLPRCRSTTHQSAVSPTA